MKMSKRITITLTEDQLWQTRHAISEWIKQLEQMPLATNREIAFYKRILTTLAKAKVKVT